ESGKSLWRYELDGRWFQGPVPYDGRWFAGLGVEHSVGGGFHQRPDRIFEMDWQRASGGVGVPYPPLLVEGDGQRLVVVVAGSRLVGLDARTGQPAWPAHDLGFWPLRAPQLADLDGSGQRDLLLLGPDRLDSKADKPG